MQTHLRVAAAIALLATSTSPVHAQSFLKRLADRALAKVQEKASKTVETLVAGDDGGADAAASTSTSGAPRARTDAAPTVMTPRAVRGTAPRAASPGAAAPAPAPAAKYPSELPRPAGFAQVKAAFDAFGKVRCPSCEGGYGFDSWPSFPRDALSGSYNENGKRLGALAVGSVHRWTGAEAAGTLTVIAEESIGGFRCRRLEYKLVKRGVSAERPGLVCWGYSGPYAGSESWNEVY